MVRAWLGKAISRAFISLLFLNRLDCGGIVPFVYTPYIPMDYILYVRKSNLDKTPQEGEINHIQQPFTASESLLTIFINHENG